MHARELTHCVETPEPDLEVCQVLVLQGGGALGAYQAGAFEALAEAGRQPEWVAGISIGAINAALIAGNAATDRVPRLRAFWHTVTSALPTPPWPLPQGPWRQWANDWSAGWAALFGRPGFFSPGPGRGGSSLAKFGGQVKAPAVPGLYDTEPLRRSLSDLVDFERINAPGAMRLSVGAVQVDTGNFVYFDNSSVRIGPEHVMASGALPPGFPAVQANGQLYWDGGLVSNTPLTHVLQHLRQPAATIFQVDLFSAKGQLPRNSDEAADRVNDIRYSSRTRAVTDTLRSRAEQHRRQRALISLLPEAQRQSPQMQQWLAEATDPAIDLVHLIRRPSSSETSRKGYDFSRPTMLAHWAAGLADMRRSLARLAQAGVATAPCEFRVFDFGRGPGPEAQVRPPEAAQD